MNREIKFRAWCSGKHGSLTFSENSMDYNVVLSKNGYWCDVESGWDIHGEYETVPIMQFTGLQDKNGKDIYEDDWCEAEFRDRHGITVIQGRIIMDDFMWCIDCRGCVGDDIFSINRPHNFKVIGNIYENPELLTQQ